MTVLLALFLLCFIVFSFAEAIHGEKVPVWKAFSETASGVVVLYAAHVLTPLTGIEAPVSIFTVSISIVLGIPGTVLLLFLNKYFL